jgi:hypothetical protein
LVALVCLVVQLINTADFISQELGRNPASRVATATLFKRRDKAAKVARLAQRQRLAACSSGVPEAPLA